MFHHAVFSYPQEPANMDDTALRPLFGNPGIVAKGTDLNRRSGLSGISLRGVAAGGVAGLAGGLLFWWALQAQDMMSSAPGLFGVKLSGSGVVLHLLASIVLGAGFGALSRYQPQAHAATISSGLLYGLLWWILGPITLGPLFEGRGPTCYTLALHFIDLQLHVVSPFLRVPVLATRLQSRAGCRS